MNWELLAAAFARHTSCHSGGTPKTSMPISTRLSKLAAITLAAAALCASAPVEAGDPWTGPYVGFNFGKGFGGSGQQTGNSLVPPPATANHTSSWSGSEQLNGGYLGGQFGYNWRAGLFLIGVETDIQRGDLSSKSKLVGPMPTANNGSTQRADVDASTSVDWFGTFRGRVGYIVPSSSLMLFATAGGAYGKVGNAVNEVVVNVNTGHTISGGGSDSRVNLGWTAGAGFEWAPAFFNRWSMKTEYLYTDLGSVASGIAGNTTTGGYYACCTLRGQNEANARWHTLRLGFNLHLN